MILILHLLRVSPPNPAGCPSDLPRLPRCARGNSGPQSSGCLSVRYLHVEHSGAEARFAWPLQKAHVSWDQHTREEGPDRDCTSQNGYGLPGGGG